MARPGESDLRPPAAIRWILPVVLGACGHGRARRSAPLVVALLLLVGWTAPAATAPRVDASLDRPGAVEVGVQVPPVLADLVAGAGARSGRRWIAWSYVAVLRSDEPGGRAVFCRATRFIEVLPGQDEAEAIAAARAIHQEPLNGVIGGWSDPQDREQPCPVEASAGLPVAIVEEAVRGVVTEQLPRPLPAIPPGSALTGLRAYLVTGHALSFGPVTAVVDLGATTAAVTLSGTGSSEVHWGDGTVTTSTVPGLPYPSGEVTHVYRDRGRYTVQVIDTWTVVYDVGGVVGGVLQARLEPVSLPDLPVRDYQAVRTTTNR